VSFAHPEMLWLALPWLAFWLGFARLQRRALGWIDRHVSPRFRPILTVHTAGSLHRHLLLLLAMGLALVVAAAGPVAGGRGEAVVEGGPVVLVLDASASMRAGDVEPFPGIDPETELNRFEVARAVARELLEQLGERPVALVTYSGVATLHLPPTTDRALLDEALGSVEVHNFYRHTGSSLGAALDAVSTLLDAGEGLQAVFLGDGEVPHEDPYEEPLRELAAQALTLHAVAVGSEEGEGREIYDFRDVLAGEESPAVLAEFHTRRVDEHFRRLARESGGRFLVAAPEAAAEVAAAIEKAGRERPVPIEQRAARRDLTALPLLLFLLGWLVDGFWIGNRRTPKVDTFDLGRLAAPLIVVVLLLGCTDPLHRAHRANERGIAADEAGRHLAARPHYLRSIGFRQRAEVPTHNLARSAVLRGDYAGAHDLFQQALELAPTLPEAHFNDGVALYLWGQSLRDPEGCQLERTRDLWSQARSRFETAREHAPEGSPLANDAAADHRFVDKQLAEVEALIAEPPAHCPPPEASEAAGGGGGGGGDEGDAGGGGGGGDDNQEGPSGGQDPEADGSQGDPPPGQDQEGTADGDAENQDDQENQEGAGAPLTTGELEEIQGQLERIREQARAGGKFHRRTAAEQFPPESWQNPEPVIWW